MIQQNCISDALCHQAISLFCRICQIMCNGWAQQIQGLWDALCNLVTTRLLEPICNCHCAPCFLSVWVGLTVFLHKCPKPNSARIALPPSPKATLPASHIRHQSVSHIRKIARQRNYKVHFLSVCSFLDSALQRPSWSVDKWTGRGQNHFWKS